MDSAQAGEVVANCEAEVMAWMRAALLSHCDHICFVSEMTQADHDRWCSPNGVMDGQCPVNPHDHPHFEGETHGDDDDDDDDDDHDHNDDHTPCEQELHTWFCSGDISDSIMIGG